MKIHYTNELINVAALEFTELLKTYKSQPVLVLLSGGSALTFLDHISTEVLDERITLGVLDERFDSSPQVNNCAQLKATQFFNNALQRGVSYIDTELRAGETLPEAAERYDEALLLWQTEHEDGIILATFGMGVDGHTAGIFPDVATLLETYTSCVAPITIEPTINTYTKRFTVTPHFIATCVTAGVAYVGGAEKCSMLERVIENDASSEDVPAILWHSVPTLTLVTDCKN